MKCDGSEFEVEAGKGKVMKKLTPIRAIRAKCLDCSCGQPSEIRNCVIPECPLFTYRFERNPGRKGVGGVKKV